VNARNEEDGEFIYRWKALQLGPSLQQKGYKHKHKRQATKSREKCECKPSKITVSGVSTALTMVWSSPMFKGVPMDNGKNICFHGNTSLVSLPHDRDDVSQLRGLKPKS